VLVVVLLPAVPVVVLLPAVPVVVLLPAVPVVVVLLLPLAPPALHAELDPEPHAWSETTVTSDAEHRAAIRAAGRFVRVLESRSLVRDDVMFAPALAVADGRGPSPHTR
jgi:hypothetical protein